MTNKQRRERWVKKYKQIGLEIIEFPTYWLNQHSKEKLTIRCTACMSIFKKTGKQLIDTPLCVKCQQRRKNNLSISKRKERFQTIIKEAFEFYESSEFLGDIKKDVTGKTKDETGTFKCKEGHVFTMPIQKISIKTAHDGYWCPHCNKLTYARNSSKHKIHNKKIHTHQKKYEIAMEICLHYGFKLNEVAFNGTAAKHAIQCLVCGKKQYVSGSKLVCGNKQYSIMINTTRDIEYIPEIKCSNECFNFWFGKNDFERNNVVDMLKTEQQRVNKNKLRRMSYKKNIKK